MNRRGSVGLTHWRRLLVASSVGVLLLILAGCGATHGTHNGANASDVVSLIVKGNANVPQENELAISQYLLTAKCMDQAGFHMAAAPTPPPTNRRGALLLTEEGSLTTVPPESSALKAAATEGFGLAARRDRPQVAARGHAEGFRSSTGKSGPSGSEEAYRRALVGPSSSTATFTVAGVAQHTYPTQGCAAKAYATLYGSARLAVEANYLPEDLNLVVEHDVSSNADSIAATKRWSECMAKATGHAVGAPAEASRSLLATEEEGSSPETPAEQSYEQRIATADTRCQYSSGYLKESTALRRSYAAHLSGPYEGLLLSILEARARASRKAQAVLAAAGR